MPLLRVELALCLFWSWSLILDEGITYLEMASSNERIHVLVEVCAVADWATQGHAVDAEDLAEL